MEGLVEMARALYARESSESRNSISSSFAQIDVNGDGKISLQEFKSLFSAGQSYDTLFNQLDKDGDRKLDFNEYLALYFAVSKWEMLRVCDGCREYIIWPFFSCLLCLGKVPDSYDICCACFQRGNTAHEHPFDNLVDPYSLIKLARDRLIMAETQKGTPEIKNETEEIYEIAKSQYRASSPEDQALAHQFFRSLDANKDRKIDLKEFLSFTSQEGYERMNNAKLFKDLDKNGNGTLDFWEVLTLHYMIKTKRPFCDSCGNFASGMFFSCVECFQNPKTAFNLCSHCYKSSEWDHSHNNQPQFLDNYTLLSSDSRDQGRRHTIR